MTKQGLHRLSLHSPTRDSGLALPAVQGGNVTDRVLSEFAGLYHELTESAGLKVNLFQHSEGHGTPDACFPNNWFSTHAAGEGSGGLKENTLVLYPMKAANRCALPSLSLHTEYERSGCWGRAGEYGTRVWH